MAAKLAELAAAILLAVARLEDVPVCFLSKTAKTRRTSALRRVNPELDQFLVYNTVVF